MVSLMKGMRLRELVSGRVLSAAKASAVILFGVQFAVVGVHKRCSGVRSQLRKVITTFQCRTCMQDSMEDSCDEEDTMDLGNGEHLK